jgi:hypothetical protein
MCSTAVIAAPLSKASAVRVPVPVKISAMALPEVHPGRLTISWTMALRSGVRWAAVRAPTVDHPGGDHGTEAVVRAREETLFVAVVKVAALSAAWPRTVTEEAPVVDSSAWNCT